jgi:general L-amino acid transport system substrate-binding protein
MFRRVFSLSACCLTLSMCLLQPLQAAPSRLSDIRSRGALNCGIWPHVAGFSMVREGTYSGFEVDICRAVAAAIFADATKIKFTEMASVGQFKQLSSVDLVVRRLTATPDREAKTGTVFGPVVFYDGQGFLVRRSAGIDSLAQLHRVCVRDVEGSPRKLLDYFRDSGVEMRLTLVSSDQEAQQALQDERCEAYSADQSWLAAARVGFTGGAESYALLPPIISKEPLAPLIRAEDTDLMQVLRWTFYAMVNAEELGVSSTNLASMAAKSARVRELLRSRPPADVLLAPGALSSILTEVGNYGEVFDRNLGAASAVKLDRGLNRLWIDGGLLYAPPLRSK